MKDILQVLEDHSGQFKLLDTVKKSKKLKFSAK